MAYWIKMDYVGQNPQFEYKSEPKDKFLFGFSLGLPIGTRRLPSVATEETKKKTYPDIFPMPGLNAVSTRFKDLIEEFEPDTHQFFPLELFRKNGERVKGQYYTFNCTVSFDSLLFDYSDVEWEEHDSPSEYPHLIVPFRQKIVLSRPAINGRHVWCPLRAGYHGVFVSDELFAAMKRQKFKYIRELHCEEVDMEWIPSENVQPILEWEDKNGLHEGRKPWLIENPERLF